MISRKLLLISLVLAAGPSFAQRTENFAGLSTGFLHITNQELILSPYIQKGTTAPIALVSEGGNGKYLLISSIEYVNTTLSSTVNNPFDVKQVSLQISYLRPLKSVKRGHVYFGPSWNTNAFATAQTFNGTTEKPSTFASMLGVKARFEKGEEKSRWILDLDQGLFGYTSRPGNLDSPPDDSDAVPSYNGFTPGHWAFLGKAWQSNASLSWESRLSQRWKFRTGAYFSYLHAGYPSAEQASSTVNLGVHLTIFYWYQTGKKRDVQGQ